VHQSLVNLMVAPGSLTWCSWDPGHRQSDTEQFQSWITGKTFKVFI